ncbi:MAG: hypothetical protein NT150_00630 [Bacteroidetes bacterium]|nr:hypothetical protein [Bacteroidota bacterium]
MNNKSQYIEPLIKLIELNNDKEWLSTFIDLRTGGSLPGGGAGSLNDWGPSYSDKTQNTWYNILYDILRYLFDNDLSAEEITSFKSIKSRNKVRIIRCLNCNNSYQHPSSFEECTALHYYNENFLAFAKESQLLNLFKPELTYNHEKTNDFKNWLSKEYDLNDIKIYDFVSGKYICPHCTKDHAETEHDLYLIQKSEGQKMFKRVKQNAHWNDFES